MARRVVIALAFAVILSLGFAVMIQANDEPVPTDWINLDEDVDHFYIGIKFNWEHQQNLATWVRLRAITGTYTLNWTYDDDYHASEKLIVTPEGITSTFSSWPGIMRVTEFYLENENGWEIFRAQWNSNMCSGVEVEAFKRPDMLGVTFRNTTNQVLWWRDWQVITPVWLEIIPNAQLWLDYPLADQRVQAYTTTHSIYTCVRSVWNLDPVPLAPPLLQLLSDDTLR